MTPLPRFVLLEHDCHSPHFDLMLEHDGQLLTWSVHRPPDKQEQLAHQLIPHRLAYLDYEGPITGSRGSVRRLASGTYSLKIPTSQELWVAQLHGDYLHGLLTLRRSSEQSARGPHWTVTLQNDL